MLKRIISIAVSAAVIMTAMVFPVTAADEVKKPEKNITYYKVPLDNVNLGADAELTFKVPGNSSGKIYVYQVDWDGTAFDAENAPVIKDENYIDEVSVSQSADAYQTVAINISDKVKTAVEAYIEKNSNNTADSFKNNFYPKPYISLAAVTASDIKILSSAEASKCSWDKTLDFDNEKASYDSQDSVPGAGVKDSVNWDRMTASGIKADASSVNPDFDLYASNGYAYVVGKDGENKYLGIKLAQNKQVSAVFYNMFGDSNGVKELDSSDTGRIFDISFDARLTDKQLTDASELKVGVASAKLSGGSPLFVYDGAADSIYGQSFYNANPSEYAIGTEFAGYNGMDIYYKNTELSSIRISHEVTSADEQGFLRIDLPGVKNNYSHKYNHIALDNIRVHEITNTPKLKFLNPGSGFENRAQYNPVADERSATEDFEYMSFKENGGVLNITADTAGLIDGTSVDLYVLNDGYAPADYKKPGAAYFNESINLTAGKFSKEISLLNLANYYNNLQIVLVENDAVVYSKKFKYENANIKNRLFDEIKASADSSEVSGIINGKTGSITNAEIIGINNSAVYNELSDDGKNWIGEYIYNKKDSISDYTELRNEIIAGAIIYNINSGDCTAAELIKMLSESKETIGFGEYIPYTVFDGSNDADKAEIAEDIMENTIDSLETLKKVLCKTTYDRLKSCGDEDSIIAIMRQSKEFFNISFDKYDKIDSKYLPKVKSTVVKFFKELEEYGDISKEFDKTVRDAKQAAENSSYKYYATFDDLTGSTFKTMTTVDTERAINYAYSDTYLARLDGLRTPSLSLVKDYDHTSGNGKSIKLYNVYSEGTGNYPSGRAKLFNVFKDSPLTASDIGQTYYISLWAYSEKDTTIDLSIMALGDTSTMSSSKKNNWGSSSYKPSVRFDIPANEWTQCEMYYTLDDVNTNDVYQVGMLTIALSSSETGDAVYLDDIQSGPPQRIKTENKPYSIEVSGSLYGLSFGNNADVYLLKDGSAPEDYTNPDSIVKKTSVVIPSSGLYNTSFDMKEVSDWSENYIAVIPIGEETYYEYVTFDNAALTDTFMESIAGAASAGDIEAVLSGNGNYPNKDILHISDIMLIDKIADSYLAEHLFANKANITDTDSLRKYTEEAILIYSIRHKLIAASEASEFAEEYQAELELVGVNAFDKVFAELSDSAKQKVFADYMFGKTYTDIKELKDAFYIAILNTAVNDSSYISASQIVQMLGENLDILGISNAQWSEYTNATGDRRTTATNQISSYVKKNGVENLSAKLSSLIPEKTNETVTPSKPTGGGGGGGGGIGTVNREVKADNTVKNDDSKNTPEDIEFSDMNSSHWAYSYVLRMVQSGIINGYEDNTFRPDGSITRAEFSKLVIKAFNIMSDKHAEFADVPQNSWYYEYVSALAGCGIVNGVSDTEFAPEAVITRQDMAVMIYRAMKFTGYSEKQIETEVSFNDSADIAGYAKEAVTYLGGLGIINGTDSNRFAPNDNATRAEAAKILSSLVNR